MHARRIEWFGPPDVSSSGFSQGREGVRQSLAAWVGAWDDFHSELRELIDSGDKVLAAGWQRGRGRGSGVEVAQDFAGIWTVRDGRIVRWDMCADRAEALEAVGLSE